jgi:osmotically-inducible protein OsmY
MEQDKWQRRQSWRNEERRRMEDEERRRVEGYGRGRDAARNYPGDESDGPGGTYRGYEPGAFPGTGSLGHIPPSYPEEGRFRDDAGWHGVEPNSGRYTAGYHPSTPGRDYRETWPERRERDWWDRAKDEVKSWTGDEAAEQRRKMDRELSNYGRGPKGYTRSDERIRDDVSDRLTDDWLVDASEVEVTVSNGEVTLTGFVTTRDAKRRAEDCAEDVSGVRHVQNNLRIQNRGDQTTLGASALGTRQSK